MEADLRAEYQVDYRDRWRPGSYGRPKLTLRALAVLVRHLSDESHVAAIGRDGPRWTAEAHLLDECRMLLGHLSGVKDALKHPHPQRPLAPTKKPDPKRAKKVADANRRARERQERIASGELT